VIACEGSMFKSKFANALATMMFGSLGLASAENKLSLAYGAEAGHMDPLIADMCARYVRNSLVITRNVESQTLLRKLGISTELGTDTAWTFEPHPPEYARKMLRDWKQARKPVFVPCDIDALEGDAPPGSSKTTDFYLSNLAHKHGMLFATLDQSVGHKTAFVIPGLKPAS